MKRRLPKSFKELDGMLLHADCAGYNRGRQDAEYQLKAQQEELKRNRESVHLKAIQALTAYCSATGQTMEALARAMQSDRGPL